MFIWSEITITTILAAYLGFAGIWGRLIGGFKTNHVLTFAFGFLIFLPASLLLPWSGITRLVAWTCALSIVCLYALKPSKLPAWLWAWQFIWGYFAFVMLLIVIWSIFSSQLQNWIALGVPSFVAISLGLRRYYLENHSPFRSRSNKCAK